MRLSLSFSLLLLSLQLNAQTFTGTGGLIPDNAATSIDFSLPVSGLSPATLSSSFGLVSVCINITHSYVGDLEISLVSPGGTSVILASGVGGSGANFTNTCFSQTAPTNIATGSAPFTGSWIPMGNLGYFNNGQAGNGTWKLHIFDNATPDQGTLLNWSITFGNSAPTVTPFTTSNLPLVIINTTNQQIPDDPKLTASMGVVYNGVGAINHTTDPFNNYNGKIGIEKRGSSSQGFPKKSYGFETWTATGNDTAVSLLGVPKESDWILSANYTDKSFFNNVLAYRLFNQFGSYAPRTKYVELVLNGQYQGIYVLMEKIKRDSNRVDVSKLTPADTAGSPLTGGYILKIDKFTGSGGGNFASSYAPLVSSGGQQIRFQYEYPSDVDIVTKQKTYIKKFVDSFESALKNFSLYDTTIGWRRYADENSFIRYFILNEVAKNVDGYRLSTYLYKTKDTKGNKLFVGPPWDYDIAFGNANYCGGNVDTGWAWQFGSVCPNDGAQVPFWWQRLMQDTLFKGKLKCAYSKFRSTSLDTTKLFGYIDSTVTFLNAAQVRNFQTWPILGAAVWPNPTPVPITYAGEILELKTFLKKRIAWLDTHIPGTCYPFLSVPETASANTVSVYPNPFTSELSLKMVSSRKQLVVIQLFSAEGKLVYSAEKNLSIGQSSFSIRAADNILSPGIYILQVRTEQESKTFKLVRE
jgi:subtilisin-like proprotein convertase family protein